jgi:hypothetical protein
MTGIRRLLSALLLVPIFWLLGCKPEEDIQKYTVPREQTDPSENEIEFPETEGPNKMRFLAAIIPAGDGYFWALRFFAAAPIVDHFEADFDKFLASIQVPANSREKPTWVVPARWRVGTPSPMAAGFRIITLHTGPKKSPIEMYLSTPVKDDRLDNLNRWRSDFVGLPKITEAELKDQWKEVTVGTTKVYRVDLRGPGSKNPGGGMRPPFAGNN